MTWTRSTLVPILVAAACAAAVASSGMFATDIGPWYQALRKPTWQPPNWLFGPTWTVIFTLIATAGVKVWWAAPPGKTRQFTMVLFAVNGVLNAGWSILFFALRRPDWALVEVFLLWLSIVALILGIRRHSRTAALLLIPYLAWVSFAGILNWTIVSLNPVVSGYLTR